MAYAGLMQAVCIWTLLYVFVTSVTSASKDDVTPLPPTPQQTQYKNTVTPNISIDCDELLPGQYYCKDPVIDEDTQQAVDCPQDTQLANVKCYPVPGLVCKGLIPDGDVSFFHKKVPCKWTNGKRFSVALLLSVFLGWLGLDRFYLGYPAIGMLKFCTFGFMFLGHLVDILLIAIQVVTPADGSAYIVDYYGAGLTRIQGDNETYIKPPDYS